MILLIRKSPGGRIKPVPVLDLEDRGQRTEDRSKTNKVKSAMVSIALFTFYQNHYILKILLIQVLSGN